MTEWLNDMNDGDVDDNDTFQSTTIFKTKQTIFVLLSQLFVVFYEKRNFWLKHRMRRWPCTEAFEWPASKKEIRR